MRTWQGMETMDHTQATQIRTLLLEAADAIDRASAIVSTLDSEDRAMISAALLLSCISATSAAFAAGKAGESADSLSCSFSAAKDASPAARCAAIKRQCGGKFHANYCGDKLLSAM